MGYMHINNLYADQRILSHPECFALEKIHGTSAHVRWQDGKVWLHHGGESAHSFGALFDLDDLANLFESHFGMGTTVVIYGEAYGGKQQKNAWRYGPVLKFVAFDVNVADQWCAVPEAHSIVSYMGLDFVHYVRIETKLSIIDAERDAISEQAVRNGVTTHGGEFIRREGVVLRQVNEEKDDRGNRIMAKHKRAEERETKTERVVDASKAEKIKEARAIAEEWVTPMRLTHVLDKLPEAVDMTFTRQVISAMIEDVEREAGDEIEPSQASRTEIGRRTGQLFKSHLEGKLSVAQE